MKQLQASEPRVKKPAQTMIIILIGIFIISYIAADFMEYSPLDSKQKVAVIPIRGMITVDATSGFMDSSSTSSSYIVQLIDKINTENDMKAIVLDINSPGGTPVASQEIALAVQESELPIIAIIRETGASGAYWIASSADYVIANRMSITGSVGVIGSYLEFSGLLENHNVTYQRMTSGQYKDIGSPFRPLSNPEELILQAKMDRIRDIFIEDVTQQRNLTEEQKEQVSSALYYLGDEAIGLGLVDELGGMNEVSKHLEEKYDITAEYYYLKQEVGFLDLLSSVSTNHGYSIGQGISENLATASRGTLT